MKVIKDTKLFNVLKKEHAKNNKYLWQIKAIETIEKKGFLTGKINHIKITPLGIYFYGENNFVVCSEDKSSHKTSMQEKFRKKYERYGVPKKIAAEYAARDVKDILQAWHSTGALSFCQTKLIQWGYNFSNVEIEKIIKEEENV